MSRITTAAGMSGALRDLIAEHRVIEDVLDALEACFEEGPAPDGTDRGVLASFAEFFRDFADGIHHHKEETLLFRRLLRDGDMAECGPVNRYLAEHNLGRDAVRRIGEAGAGRGPLTGAERAAVTETARAYAGMLRGHIHREDNELFPAADRVLPRESAEQLLREFERYERDPETVSRRRRCLDLARELVGRFPPGRSLHGETR